MIKIIYNLSMSRITIGILLAVLALSHAQTVQLYKKIIHNTDPEAKCLDGSSPAVYFHQGAEKSKFIIYFVGGGYCMGLSTSQVLESCYKRSKTDFGSSKNLPDTFEGHGFLSTNPAISKFASWTKIIFNYCDGGLHSSATKIPYKYKDTSLYFHGKYITRSHFKWLTDNFGFSSAERVLLSGSSAGGMAAYIYSLYASQLLANPEVLSLIIDSDAMMDLPTVSGQMKMETQGIYLYKVANVDESTPLEPCNIGYAYEPNLCYYPQFAWVYLKAPALIITSQYDSWFIYNGSEINCVTEGKHGKTLANCTPQEMSLIEKNRKVLLDWLDQFGQVSRNSVWAISCSTHMYIQYDDFYDSPNQRVPGGSGYTARTAIEKFVFEGERFYLVDVAWPGNTACAY